MSSIKQLLINTILILINLNKNNGAFGLTPVVLWHGMGDSCCFSISLGSIQKFIEQQLPGVYVKSIQIGETLMEDVENSYLKNVNEQIEIVCHNLTSDEKLKSGFNAVGFSQGGQFLRGLVQRCSNLNVKNLITLGGQHQGVYGLPKCGPIKHKICDKLRQLLNYAAYFDFIQSRLVQAEYWHDPLQEHKYQTKSIFLADINNELTINETYRKNLKRLENLVLVMFDSDTMIQPKESSWFGFYKPGQSVQLETLQDSRLYNEDRIGLKEMDEAGKIHFLSTKGDHLHFTDLWFKQEIIDKYLI